MPFGKRPTPCSPSGDILSLKVDLQCHKVSAVEIPSFAATERIAAYSVSYSPRCSATSRTARSRSSLGYCFGERLPRWAGPRAKC